MHTYPPAEDARDCLHPAGWSVGEVGTAGGSWLVTGTNGENRIKTWARTPEEAWHRACEQAAAVGMLAPELGSQTPQSSGQGLASELSRLLDFRFRGGG